MKNNKLRHITHNLKLKNLKAAHGSSRRGRSAKDMRPFHGGDHSPGEDHSRGLSPSRGRPATNQEHALSSKQRKDLLDLFVNWSVVLRPDWVQCLRPVRIDNTNGIITLCLARRRTNRSYGFLFVYQTDQILHAINSFYGCTLVNRLRFMD